MNGAGIVLMSYSTVKVLAILILTFPILLPLETYAGHGNSEIAVEAEGLLILEQESSQQVLERVDRSERQVEELIASDMQSQRRTRLKAYEAAGIAALTGGMMLVGALAGGPVMALAAGVGTLTIYTAFD